jgi:hypothetical protein
LAAKAHGIATLDIMMAKNAKQLKLKHVAI